MIDPASQLLSVPQATMTLLVGAAREDYVMVPAYRMVLTDIVYIQSSQRLTL